MEDAPGLATALAVGTFAFLFKSWRSISFAGRERECVCGCVWSRVVVVFVGSPSPICPRFLRVDRGNC